MAIDDSLERARLHPDVLKNLNKNKKLRTAEAYSEDNPPPYPVTSVNGQTGDVTVQGGSGSGIAIQDDEPTDGELVWIDTDDPGTTHIIPEIDDTQESAVDTWSSQKIAGYVNVTDLSITATAASGVTIRSFGFHKKGKIIFGNIYFDVTSAISSGADIATLNSSLPVPIGAYAVAAVCSSTGTPGMVYITRGSSGKIRAWSSLAAGNYYYAQLIYVAQ